MHLLENELVWDLHLKVQALWYSIHCICLRVAAAELWESRILSACNASCMLGTDSICNALLQVCLYGRFCLCMCLIAAVRVCVYVYYSLASCVMCACMCAFWGVPPRPPSGGPSPPPHPPTHCFVLGYVAADLLYDPYSGCRRPGAMAWTGAQARWYACFQGICLHVLAADILD